MTTQNHTTTMTAVPAIRYRSRTGLRHLDTAHPADVLFPAYDARHDRVKVRVAARVHLSQPELWEDYIGEIAPPDHAGLFVTSAPQAGAAQFKLRVRGTKANPLWLIAGGGIVRWRQSAGFFDIALDLDVNPTRFLAHQPDPSVTAIHERGPLDAFRVNVSAAAALRAMTLDASDNVLTTLAQLGGTTFTRREAQWDAVLAAHFDQLSNALIETLAPPHIGAELEMTLSVAQAETYWELSVPDAVSTIGALCQSVKMSDGAARLSQRADIGGEANAQWIKMPLTDDADLKFYAKTSDRIRVEITHHDRIAQFAGRNGRPMGAGVAATLRALSRDAANRLHRVWTAIMNLHALQADAADVCDFMSKLNAAVPEQNRRLILSLLANHRALTETTVDGFAPASVCRALRRTGVLVPIHARNRAAARYVLTPAYSAMFDRLLDRRDAVRPLIN
ncbi:hypothetical protein LGR54_20825 [Ancylobacter sp. Lp-2]|uniref:hypothetical protein n=1 Tax=Ancylobacter sp. Lp-2 TaxID=2881339 RepID=UPI001E2BBC77|nr:hypothetical protein [Ancylobacter sp. Lp-2]MCB4771058.1 hypothetical protein [Ancylobacter sp. Lp-2]